MPEETKPEVGPVKWIGKQLVKTVEVVGDKTNITFDDDSKISFKTCLYDLIVSDVAQESDLQTTIYDRVTRDLVGRMAELGMSYYSIDAITPMLSNYLVNRMRVAIGKKFGYEHESQVLMSDVLEAS